MSARNGKTNGEDRATSRACAARDRRRFCNRLRAAQPLAADADQHHIAYAPCRQSRKRQARVPAWLDIRRRPFLHRQQLDRDCLHLSGGDARLAGMDRGVPAGALSGGLSGTGMLGGMAFGQSCWLQSRHTTLHLCFRRMLDRCRMAAQLGVYRICLEPGFRGFPGANA